MSRCTSTTLKNLTQQTHLKHNGFFVFKKHSKLFCDYQQSDSKVAMKGQKIQKGQRDAEEKCEQSHTDNPET